MKARRLFFLLIATISLSACDSNNNQDGENSPFRLSVTGVDPLEGGYHYEGWLLANGVAVPAGKFNISESGGIVDLQGNLIPNGEFDVDGDVRASGAYVMTIEPPGDTDTTPSQTHYLSGVLTSGNGTLGFTHPQSFGDDFSTANGEYILATPTNGADSDELSGIWFLDPTGGTPSATLQLPVLPDGWVYEGWVVLNGTPITTGTFLSVAGPDGFDGFSGTNDGPPFPGEDFLVNAPTGVSFPPDLSGMTAVISIEPSPDDSAAPFTLKPLVGNIPAAAIPMTVYAMDNNANTFPTGSISAQ